MSDSNPYLEARREWNDRYADLSRATRNWQLVAASAKIRAELGWEPRKPALTDMVADAWAFAQAHPQGYAGAPAAQQR